MESTKMMKEVKSSYKTTSTSSLNITFYSHKDLKMTPGMSELVDVDENVSKHSRSLKTTCDLCKIYYSYTGNSPCIMKCGISICQSCVSYNLICKDCESMEETNLPTNVINKDLKQNNSIILKALKRLDDFTLDINIEVMNSKLTTHRLDLQKLDDRYNEVLSNKLSAKHKYTEILKTCEKHLNMIQSCIDNHKILRLRIANFNTNWIEVENLHGKFETLQVLMTELEPLFLDGFFKFTPTKNFQTIVKFTELKFSNDFVRVKGFRLKCYSYSKREKYNRVYFDGPFILLQRGSEEIDITKGHIIMFDEQSVKLQTITLGIFFQISEGNFVRNIPIRFKPSAIGKQIMSYCCIDASPFFINGRISIDTEIIVIKIGLDKDPKYWSTIDDLDYIVPLATNVSLTQIEDRDVTLTIHLVDSDKKAYVIGSVKDYPPELLNGSYPIICDGLTTQVIIE